jgi:uncharacterized protein YndB with AHSA1/START domain
MFKKIAVVVVVLLLAVLGFAATKPDTFRVERTATIKAPPEKIFPLIADFHSWADWSPYEQLDPAMKKSYSGAPSGKGAVYEWEGNAKAGKGRAEITDSSPARVTIALHFLKPFKADNIAEFTLTPHGDSTSVTWAMHGPNLFVGKVMGTFFSMDKMIGQDFEAGLANIKTLAEK